MALDYLGRIGLHLLLAFLAPNDRAHAGGDSIAKRHRLGAR
jgi:hypothetical protein